MIQRYSTSLCLNDARISFAIADFAQNGQLIPSAADETHINEVNSKKLCPKHSKIRIPKQNTKFSKASGSSYNPVIITRVITRRRLYKNFLFRKGGVQGVV